MKRSSVFASVRLVVLAGVSLAASTTLAGYSQYGSDMAVTSGSIANGELHVQHSSSLWDTNKTLHGQMFATDAYSTVLDGIACDSYAKAWLVTAVYGGKSVYTATVATTVNGNQVDSLIVGGTNDANPGVNGCQTSGCWLIYQAVDPTYLNKNGLSNTVSTLVSGKTAVGDGTYQFDGRAYYQALVTVAQKSGLNNTLDYTFAAGNACLNTNAAGTTSRTVDLASLSAPTVSQADLYAIYTYGNVELKDKLLFNEHSLFGDDATAANPKSSYSQYDPDFLSASTDQLTPYLSSTNQLRFTVNSADFGSGSVLDTNLVPQVVAFGVTHPVPEPSVFCIFITGLVTWWALRSRS